MMVSPPGFEPGASGLGGSRSILLSYGDVYDFSLILRGFSHFVQGDDPNFESRSVRKQAVYLMDFQAQKWRLLERCV